MQRLLLEQFRREHVEHIPVLGQDRPGLVVRGLDQLAHLIVDVAGHLVAVVGLTSHGAAEERITVLGAVADRPEFGTHAVLGHHRPSDLGGLLDIGDRAGGRLPEHQLLGGPATHGKDQAGDHLRAGHQALVVLGHRHGVPTGATPGQDGHLINGFDVAHRPRRQGVAAFVVRGDLLLGLADDPALASRAADHPVDGLFQRGTGDHRSVLAGGQQCGFVDHVGQIRAGHPHGALGQAVQIGTRSQWLALRVHSQHRFPAGQIGRRDRDLAVEPAGPQQCRIQNVRAVGGGDEDHTLALTEPIHLDE